MVDPEHRRIDLSVAVQSIDEIQAALEPQYSAIHATMLGSQALHSMHRESDEVRARQAEADSRMLTSFADVLPEANMHVVTKTRIHYGELVKGVTTEFVAQDLFEIKLLQAYSVWSRFKDLSDSNYKGAIQPLFIAGSRPIDGRHSELLLVSYPRRRREYSLYDGYYDRNTYPAKTFAPELYAATVSSRQFEALLIASHRILQTEITPEQAKGLDKDGQYHWPIPDSDKLTLSSSIGRGFTATKKKKISNNALATTHEVASFDVEKQLTELAVAFGKTALLKRLLTARQELVEADPLGRYIE